MSRHFPLEPVLGGLRFSSANAKRPQAVVLNMRGGTQAMLGGAFMLFVDRVAAAAVGMDFSLLLVPMWLLGVVVFAVGVWLRVMDL